MSAAEARHPTDEGRAQAAEPQAPAQAREHFVPIRKEDLLELLCHDPRLAGQEAERFRELARILQATFHFEYHDTLETIKNAYAYFNPDLDTPPRTELTDYEREQRLDGFFEKLNWILARANYTCVSREDLEAVLGKASAWGINLTVDFDIFDRLELYSRGAVLGKRARRTLATGFRLKEYDVPVYQRAIVIFRLKPHSRLPEDIDTHSIYIKVFKDIPRIDLEMLLPGTSVRMTALEKLKVWVPSLTGIGYALSKILRGAVLTLGRGIVGILLFLGFLGGTLGYGLRSLYGYLSTKQKYQLNLTRSLYYQNVGNNSNVLFHLLDEAEEQENREALLGYFLLWKQAGENGWTAQELNSHAEAYIRHVSGRDVDYDIQDALRKFHALKIVTETPDGRLRALPLERALEVLDEAWNDYFQYTKRLPASCRVALRRERRAGGQADAEADA